MVQTKNIAPKCDINVYCDKGSLALRFPGNYNPHLGATRRQSYQKAEVLGVELKGHPFGPESERHKLRSTLSWTPCLDVCHSNYWIFTNLCNVL
jgi:hypothetical protein